MRIERDGRTTGYDDTGGGGIPLVLLHGFPLDRTIWTSQVRHLGGSARVVAPDLRGFGESTTAGSPPTMDGYASDVAGLLDLLGIPAAVIGGLSMGGFVAMAFQRAFPGRVLGLLLVDTRGGPDSPEARASRDALAAVARSEGAPAVAAAMLPKMLTPANRTAPMGTALSALMGSQSVEGIAGALGAIRDRPDSAPSNARIRVPTLVVCGAEDILIPPEESRALRESIPGALLEMVPAAAHLPNYERPEAFNTLVRGFLREIPRTRPG